MGIQRFASRVSHARNVGELAACVLDESGALVGSPILGFYLFRPDGIEFEGRNVPSLVIDRYETIGRPNDPVLAAVRETHAPFAASFDEVSAHARDPSMPDEYRAFIDDVLVVSRNGQYLVAPLVVGGDLIGTINCSRAGDHPFSPRELAAATALSLHVSTRLAALRALDPGLDPAWEEHLTSRGREIAELAARGLTTHEMGRALGVSPNTVKKHLRVVYEKLGVATRAELASIVSLRPSPGASRAR